MRGISWHGEGLGQVEVCGAVVVAEADVGRCGAVHIGAVDTVDLENFAAGCAVGERCSEASSNSVAFGLAGYRRDGRSTLDIGSSHGSAPISVENIIPV